MGDPNASDVSAPANGVPAGAPVSAVPPVVPEPAGKPPVVVLPPGLFQSTAAPSVVPPSTNGDHFTFAELAGLTPPAASAPTQLVPSPMTQPQVAPSPAAPSQLLPSDAAPPAPPSKPGHGDHAAPPSPDGLAQILTRQWPVVVATTALAVLLAVVYLMVSPKVYTASAKLRVSPLDTRSMTGTGGGGDSSDSAQAEDYLDTECVVIKSDAVLVLALDSLRGTLTFRGNPHPLEALKAGLDATVAKKGKAIEVSFDSRYPREAEQIVGAVVDAYRTYNANYWQKRQDQILSLLTTGNGGQEARLKELLDRQHLIVQMHGSLLNADPDKSPAHLDVVNYRDAKSKADLEAISARTAYQETAKAIMGDAAKVAAVDRALRTPAYIADPQGELKRVQDEMQVQQARLTDARTQYMPGHPVVRAIQAHIDQLSVDAVVAAKRWQDAAEANQRALEHSLLDAQRVELEDEQTQVEYGRLEAQIKLLQGQEEGVQGRIHDAELSRGAGAVNISLLDDPHVDMQHVKPGKVKTLAIGVVLGLILGSAMGCVRDWSDDRFRTLPAIRMAAGAPVLGAIPSISAAVAASAADRAQVVFFDPFGDAAESYRTLRTALQFGMPPRTKTLLVTSPTAGDGKSTLVSNLAIAMAQANKRVLVVDADLRAPVQHRLFGLSDRTGLASVLDGSDTLDHAIQRTNIEGLDVLPAGPIPSNPAEMLNTPEFGDHLNDLADRYDLVLVDSPPVTAVTDARILAALADASLLVVRLGSSTRRHTETARDALRGVGARLVGVAVNGVARRGNLASATGYYGRPEVAPSGPVNLGLDPMAAYPSMPTAANPGVGRLGHDPLSSAVRSAPPPARR